MDFNLTEDQLAFREAARAFAEKAMTPHAAKWDDEHIFPVDVMKEAGEMGFMGMYTPEALGGSRFDLYDAECAETIKPGFYQRDVRRERY